MRAQVGTELRCVSPDMYEREPIKSYYASKLLRCPDKSGSKSSSRLVGTPSALLFDRSSHFLEVPINCEWNRLGADPATEGFKGCVYDLALSANRLGIYWGWHFSRKDGIHFEIALRL